MYENEIIEVMNCKRNRKRNERLRQWYHAKVKEITLLLIEKLESQNIQIERLELRKDMQDLSLEIPEEVLSK